MCTGSPFSGAKARPGHDTDHSPPSSVEVEYEQELYLLSTQAPSKHVVEELWRLLIIEEIVDQLSRHYHHHHQLQGYAF
jgi:hypothetical protein